jgi:hypothetical protein
VVGKNPMEMLGYENCDFDTSSGCGCASDPRRPDGLGSRVVDVRREPIPENDIQEQLHRESGFAILMKVL